MHLPPDRREFLKTAMAAGSAWALGAEGEGQEPSAKAQTPQPAPAQAQPRAHGEGARRAGGRGRARPVSAPYPVGNGRRGGSGRMRPGRGQGGPGTAAWWKSGVSPGPLRISAARPTTAGCAAASDRPGGQCHALAVARPVALAALEAGKHVATEVPGRVDGRRVLAVGRGRPEGRQAVCAAGKLLLPARRDADLEHGPAGTVWRDHARRGGLPEGRARYRLPLETRRQPGLAGPVPQDRKGNALPTHDIGPLAQWLDIHRGDRFEYLVSMGGNARGFNEYAAQYFGPTHFLATTPFDMADINLCLIRTVKGRHGLPDLRHAPVASAAAEPIPPDGEQGDSTTGPWRNCTWKGRARKRDRWHGEWEAVAKYYQEFDHPGWREFAAAGPRQRPRGG